MDMSVNNAYPYLPEQPFQTGSMDEARIIEYLKKFAASLWIIIVAYIFFRNETGGGKSVIYNNLCNAQADGAKLGDEWDSHVVATCVGTDHMGNKRRFVIWDSWETLMAFLIARIKSRGLFIGGYAHPYANMYVKTLGDLVTAYWREWVMGDGVSLPDTEEISEFRSMWNDGCKLFAFVDFGLYEMQPAMIVSPIVGYIQQKLNDNGFNCGIDNEYWTGTAQAVKMFQLKNSLSPNGMVDVETFNKLAA